jgi:dipeptidyl aminopeptidase/acylaminoacyl peptidase
VSSPELVVRTIAAFALGAAMAGYAPYCDASSAGDGPVLLPPEINQVHTILDNSVEHNAAGIPGLSPERLLQLINTSPDMRRLGPIQLSIDWFPDGKRILATLPYRVGQAMRIGVFTVDVATSSRLRVVDGSMSRLSPDGGRVAFLNPAGSLRVARLNTKTSAVASERDFTSINTVDKGISEFAWSPDSRALAYTSHSGEIGRNAPKDVEVSIVQVDTGRTRLLYRSQDNVGGLVWSRRGIFLARGQSYIGDGSAAKFWGEISLLDPSTGEIHKIVDKSGFDLDALAPSVAPDEESIAYGYDPLQVPPVSPLMIPAIHALGTDSTTIYSVKSNYALTDGRPQWLRQSEAAVYRCKVGGLFSSFCLLKADTNTMRRVDVESMREIGVFAASKTSDRLAWFSEDLAGTIRLQVSGENLRGVSNVYSFNRFDIRGIALGEVRTVHWSTAEHISFDGLLILPVNYIQGQSYPLIVDIHGGPTPGIHFTSSLLIVHPLEWQMWAAKGYAVFVADYRSAGVAGLNDEYFHRTKGFLEDGDVADVVSGIDEVIRMRIADPHRIGAIGHSFGAIVIDWLITHSDRLQAAVVKEGLPAWWDGIKPTPALRTPLFLHYREWYMGTDDLHREQIERENSAITYADRVKTPVLWMSGNTGLAGVMNVPQLYVNSINAAGGCARLMFFPDEGHVFIKQEHMKDVLAGAIGWFNHWLKGEGVLVGSHTRQARSCDKKLDGMVC